MLEVDLFSYSRTISPGHETNALWTYRFDDIKILWRFVLKHEIVFRSLLRASFAYAKNHLEQLSKVILSASGHIVPPEGVP